MCPSKQVSVSVLLLSHQAITNTPSFILVFEKFRRQIFVIASGWTNHSLRLLRTVLLALLQRFRVSMNRYRANFTLPYWYSLLFSLELVLEYVFQTPLTSSFTTSAANHASAFGFHLEAGMDNEIEILQHGLQILENIKEDEFDLSINPPNDPEEGLRRQVLLTKLREQKQFFQASIKLLKTLHLERTQPEWVHLAVAKFMGKVTPVDFGNGITNNADTVSAYALHQRLSHLVFVAYRTLAKKMNLLNSFLCYSTISSSSYFVDVLVDVEEIAPTADPPDRVNLRQGTSRRIRKLLRKASAPTANPFPKAPSTSSNSAKKQASPRNARLLVWRLAQGDMENSQRVLETDERDGIMMNINISDLCVIFSPLPKFCHTDPRTGKQSPHFEHFHYDLSSLKPPGHASTYTSGPDDAAQRTNILTAVPLVSSCAPETSRSLSLTLSDDGRLAALKGCPDCHLHAVVLRSKVPLFDKKIFFPLYFRRLDEKTRFLQLIESLAPKLSFVAGKAPPILAPKNSVQECVSCSRSLNLLRLRQRCRCRYCGDVFCTDCCSLKLSLPELGYPSEEKFRVCGTCFRKVWTQLKSAC